MPEPVAWKWNLSSQIHDSGVHPSLQTAPSIWRFSIVHFHSLVVGYCRMSNEKLLWGPKVSDLNLYGAASTRFLFISASISVLCIELVYSLVLAPKSSAWFKARTLQAATKNFQRMQETGLYSPAV